MLKRGDRSDAVRDLQLNLMALGYPLPRYGADGAFGGELTAAMAMFMREHGAEADDDPIVVSDDELELVQRLIAGKSLTPNVHPSLYYDRRQYASRKHVYGRRSWKEIKGITLHQTACRMGEKPERFDNMGAHWTTTPMGRAIRLHDEDELVVHAHGWNKQCVGLEMGGLYAGIKGDLSTVWNDPSTPAREMPMTPSRALIEASIAVCEFTIENVARHGGQILYIVAHRQSIDDRDSDPGQELWQAVGCYIRDKYKLSDNGGRPIGKGHHLPAEWGTGDEYAGHRY